MIARSESTKYYADKRDLLARIFGSEVRVAEDAIYVGEVRYRVLDDVIVALPSGRSPTGTGGDADPSGHEFSVDVQTSFGDQWQKYSEVTAEHRAEFAQYFDLVDLGGLRDAVVADLGCGSGRYAACVAQESGSLVLVDFSEAIFVARRNLQDAPNTVFVMADLLDLPFSDGGFDFAYSLGVLHHLPVPALDALHRLSRLSSRFLVYLYYSLENRPPYFRSLLTVADGLRRRLSRLRSPMLQNLAVWVITLLAYWPLARLGALLAPLRLDRRLPLAEFYQGKPLRRLQQDAHDRFLTSIEQRVSRREIAALADADWCVTVSEGLPYWHFLWERRAAGSGDAVASTPDVVGSVTSTCPICEGEATSGGEVVSYGRIWAALEAEFGVAVPALVKDRYTPAPTTVLAPCASCGLRFFSPAVAGGPDFYALLDAKRSYYNGVTWEGEIVASMLSGHEDVVDFGCGDGALLRKLPSRTGRSVGVDHNSAAIDSLRATGVEAYSLSFEEFSWREQEKFDTAWAMQVLEHLPDVTALLEACRRVLRPGGRLFIAVPNAGRVVDRFEPQDCPPHHISRWRESDLSMLADRFGFELVRVDREPGHDDLRRLVVRRALEQRFRLGRAGRAAARGLARVTPASALLRAVRALAPQEEVCGHSLLAELRRLDPDSPGT